MTTIILIVHLLIALALVGVILLQRSEGGALGIGGGGFGGLMTGRASANLLTRTTAVLAAGFIATSLLLAIAREPQPGAALDPRPAGRAGAPAGAARTPGRAERAACRLSGGPAPRRGRPATCAGRQPSRPIVSRGGFWPIVPAP